MACMGMACIVMAPSCGTSWMVGSGPIADILLRSVAYYLHAYMPTCVYAYMPTRLHAYMSTCLHAYMPTRRRLPWSGPSMALSRGMFWMVGLGPIMALLLWSAAYHRDKKKPRSARKQTGSARRYFLYGSMGSSWICCCTYRAAATDMFGSRTKLRALLAIHGAYFRPWATIQAMSHAAGYGPCCRP